MGTEMVDGVATKIISFARPDVRAWFRVWVRESDGIVVREDMRAEGHLMDHTFADLNGVDLGSATAVDGSRLDLDQLDRHV
jgi:hypothetical protein